MKKTLMALALTLVAGSMIACGEAPPAANNANTMNKPTTAPVNKPTEMPAANSNYACCQQQQADACELERQVVSANGSHRF
ncbi:MAG: hypothetical protein IPF53_17315 [Blastocatellia bacterium]|nr:hypothetical protein [Blastocatellia bacterium]